MISSSSGSTGQDEGMTRTKSLLPAVVVVIFVSFIFLSAVLADETVVFIRPSELTVENGKIFEVEVVIRPGEGIAGYQLSVGFDPSVLEPLTVREGDLLRKYGANTYFTQGTTDRDAGIIRDVICVMLENGGVLDEGVAAVLRFRGKKTGTSAISLFDVLVGNPSGQEVQIRVSGATVHVRGRGGFPIWILILTVIVLVLVAVILVVRRTRSRHGGAKDYAAGLGGERGNGQR